MRNQPTRQALLSALGRRLALGKASVRPAGFRDLGQVARNAVEVAWEEEDWDLTYGLIAVSEQVSCEETKERLSGALRESAVMQKKKLWRGYLERLSGSVEELPGLLTTALATMQSFNCPQAKAEQLVSEAAALRNITLAVPSPPQQAASLLPADPLGVL